MLPCFLTGLFEDDWPYILEVHIFRDSGWGVRASMEDPKKRQGISGRKSQGGLLYPLLIQLASQEAVLASMKMQNFSKQKCYFQSFCRHFHYWTSWSRVSVPDRLFLSQGPSWTLTSVTQNGMKEGVWRLCCALRCRS